jgi:lysyl-tRNA synthetase class I
MIQIVNQYNPANNFEKKKNNLILFQKLSDIYTKPSNSKISLTSGYISPPISIELEQKNKNFMKTNKGKWEIFNITKENNNLQKRLINTASNFFRKASPDEFKTTIKNKTVRSKSILPEKDKMSNIS